ncbi:MAG TPA: response regulator [Sphingomicrobium sp.]|nr:response regulator [Sphingomicrobium sp.]
MTAEQDNLAGRRILMVEDEMMLALLIGDYLETLGCRVCKAGRLDKALALAQSETLDGVLLDLNLGGKSSAPVAAELDRRGIPWIVTTGYNADRLPDEQRGRPVLQKPYLLEDMEQLMVATFKAEQ